ncbi:hypothetical protein HBI04_019980 [Parastagonospora nodorum]|nr:hypothetical protein HBH46_138160 [Parastagonospora nodorum]KAH4264999.1 hypothetical protein HBI03_081560 [Parastagonospora nodorum]KAH4283196.1 hypothetical protein HBI04_019980 [Parastagonospora nodorum]KAH4973674.1 hypothetical protein HBI78_004910 [Parastagonospora nodorum]KAH5122925.1 hypothetical protein HBH71_037920 [Parastagonospora nodorum]
MDFLYLRQDAPRGLKIVQTAQASIVVLTVIATFLTAVIPQKHKTFTFDLLYSLIFTSITTTILVRKERLAAAKNLLTKDKYVKYQMFKIVAAFGMYFIGFILWIASMPKKQESLRKGESGMILGGVKINRYQGWIMWMHFFNWVFLWSSLFYSCCMAPKEQGAIALPGDEAALNAGDLDDEEYARRQQAEGPNWQG